MIHQHLQQLQQIIFAKDQELIANKQRMVAQDTEIGKLTLQNQALAQKAASQESSSGHSNLSQIQRELQKEKALTSILNEQLLETEKALRDEVAKRKIAEDKLFNAIYQRQQAQAAAPHTNAGDSDQLLELANEEISRKELQLRDSKKKSEIYEGEGLEKRSKTELQNAQKQLGEVLKIVNQLLK